MLTAVAVKILWGLGGLVVGWIGKHWHVAPVVAQANAIIRHDTKRDGS